MTTMHSLINRYLLVALIAMVSLVSCALEADELSDGEGLEDSYSADLACPARKRLPGPSSSGIIHPGGLMSPEQVTRLWSLGSSTDATVKRAIAALAATTPVDYQPHVVVDFKVDYEKTEAMKEQHRKLVEMDGVQAYQQALMFQLTCDERYARNTLKILDAWATGNRTFGGQNAPLEGAWATASMARAAELLKHTYANYDLQVEARYLRWVRDKIEPEMNRMIRWEYSTWLNNWHLSIAEAKLQLAILRNNRGEFDNMVNYFKRMVDGRTGTDRRTGKTESDRYVMDWGQTKETCRDIVHAQFGIGSLIQIPEIAWHQNVDLYSHKNNILTKVLEYHAPLITGGSLPPGTIEVDPDPTKYGKPCVLSQVGFLPVWEIGYHHYANRKGMTLTNTRALLAQKRPEKYVFHWGAGTLTHAGTGSNSSSGMCTDIPPDNRYTCEQQVGWGKCGEPWMQGYCLQSCGQC